MIRETGLTATTSSDPSASTPGTTEPDYEIDEGNGHALRVVATSHAPAGGQAAPRRRWMLVYLLAAATLFAAAFAWRVLAPVGSGGAFPYFAPMTTDASFSTSERGALIGALLVAVLAIAYAGMLVRQVVRADQGTQKMKDVAAAIREGADAYLVRQFKVVALVVVGLVVLLYASRAIAAD